MQKNNCLLVAILALVIAGAGCGKKAGKLAEPSKITTPPVGPVGLKIKWPVGERVVQNMDMKTTTETTVPGQPAPMKQDMTMGQKYALTVLKEIPGGGHEVEMEFLSARMAMEMGGKSMMNYDSAKKSADDAKNPVAAMFGKIIGSKIQCFLDTSNNVERIEGVDEMVARISAGGSRNDIAPLKSMFGEGYFKQMMSSSRFLPPKPVSPGDTWPVQLEFPMLTFGTLVLDYTITFHGWEMHGKRNCARLDFEGSVKSKSGATSNPNGMTINIKDGSTSGTSWFDPELGITIDTAMTQDMTIGITLPKNMQPKSGGAGQPQSISSQMHQEMNIKLDSLK